MAVYCHNGGRKLLRHGIQRRALARPELGGGVGCYLGTDWRVDISPISLRGALSQDATALLAHGGAGDRRPDGVGYLRLECQLCGSLVLVGRWILVGGSLATGAHEVAREGGR